MKRPNFWTLMVVKDDWILSALEFIRRVVWFFELRRFRYARAARKLLTSIARPSRESLFVVLNGPSVKNQDLGLLKGRDLIFVNRGFLHPLYRELKPKYHVFIDSKMLNGIWDPGWLRDIRNIVPDIIFVLPIRWALHPKFKFCSDEGFKIIWLPETGGLRGIGVAGPAFELGFMLGYSQIFFTGFEATGFAQDLLKDASHFYGFVDDKELESAEDIMRGYYMNARQMRELICFAHQAERKGVRLVNMTEGGLLHMFERRKFGEF